jgi:Sulfotransferase family/Tetratricopeptide repeat
MTATAEQATLWVNKALEAFKARDRDATAAFLSKAVETSAPLREGWGPVSRIASMIGEVESALVAARRFAAVDPANGGSRLALGQMLAHHGRIEEAKEVGIKLTYDQSRNFAAWHFLGTCRAQLGETEQSIADLRKAIALSPTPAATAASWHAIAEAKTFQAGDPDLIDIIDLIKSIPEIEENYDARSTAFYALGKAYHDVGESDLAFDSYSKGAAIIRPHRTYDADATDLFVQQVISGWTTEFHASLPNGQNDTVRPIFVFGLPRSGTTLVEQILASHDEVKDGAELSLFNVASMSIRGFTPDAVSEFIKNRGQDGFTAVGQAYLHMLDERFGFNGRIIDKTLNHSRYLGLISKCLPEARFIWLRRSPGAVAWSCFRTRFSRGVDWSQSLSDMGRYFIGEDKLHEHWTSVLGDKILTIPYDDLVLDVDPWIDRILKHCDLPYRSGLRDFHTTKRAVTTASFAQVRRPLYTTSREAWRRYQTHLQPFFEAYGQTPH